MRDEALHEQGLAIRAARLGRGMTQSVLADAAGVSEKTVRRAEGGERLQGETVQALCSVLGLDPTRLRSEAEMDPKIEQDRRRQRIRVGALTAVATLSFVAASVTAVHVARAGGGAKEAMALTFDNPFFSTLLIVLGLCNTMPFFRPVRAVLAKVPGLPAFGRRIAFLEHYGLVLTFILFGYGAATVLPFAVADGWTAYITGGGAARILQAAAMVLIAPIAVGGLSAMIAGSDLWPARTERRLAAIAKAG